MHGDLNSPIIAAVAATGFLLIGGGSSDGQTIAFDDGHGHTMTLVYQTTPVNPNEFNFIIGSTFFYNVFATQAIANSVAIAITYDGNITVSFTHNIAGTAGNVPIVNGVSGASVGGMSGGVDAYSNWHLYQNGDCKLKGALTVNQIHSDYSAIDTYCGLVLHAHNISMNDGGGTGGGSLIMDGGNISNVAQINQTTQVLVDDSVIYWNANGGTIAEITLGDVGRTLTITGVVAGTTYILKIIQDSGGNRTITTYTNFKWAGGTIPTLSTAAGAEDVLSAITWDGTNFYGILQKGFA